MRYMMLCLLLFLATTSLTQAAVHLSRDHTGQALIIPYYTTANNLNSLITISNTVDQTKAIKVLIREGYQGAVIRQFSLYLDPYDSWTFVMYQQDDQLQLLSQDASCAPGFTDDPPQPAGEHDPLTGMLEIIEMGHINPDSNMLPENGLINNCQVIEQAWFAGGPNSLWQQNPAAEMAPVTGGLTAGSSVVDVSQGLAFQVPVTALDDFFPSGTIAHHSPAATLPDLSSGSHESLLLHEGQPVRTLWPTGYEAVSALLMTHTLENNFNAQEHLGGLTEMIHSYPTWHFHRDNPETTEPFLAHEQYGFRYPLLNSFDEFFLYDHVTGAAHQFPPILPDPIPPPWSYYRKASTFTEVIYHQHQPDFTSTLSGEFRSNVGVIVTSQASISNTDTELDSGKIYLRFSERFSSGNGRGVDPQSLQAQFYHGLPMIGFSVTRAVNGQLDDNRLANYINAQPMTFMRQIDLAGGEQ
jgi:hypothetical protein